MKKILIFTLFILIGLSGFSQVKRPTLDWGITVADITATDSINAATLTATANVRGLTLTLFGLSNDATADSVLTLEGGVVKKTAFSVIIDTTKVIFWYDTASVGKISTQYDLDTLVASVYDTLLAHLDSLQSHNTRLNALLDTAGVHLDSLQAHDTRINLLVDSIAVHLDSLQSHNTRINTTLDTAAVHLDTLQSHNTRINTVYDTAAIHLDSIQSHNTRINAVLDTTGIHLDSIQSHNTRILATLDSIARHTDTLQSHNTRILATIDSLGRHTDTLQSHNTRILATIDSLARHTDTLQSHNTRINDKWAKSDTTSTIETKAYNTSKLALKAPLASPTFTGTVTAPVVAISSTDTSSGTYPVGSMFVRIAAGDTSVWVKIRMDGVLSARWKKLTP